MDVATNMVAKNIVGLNENFPVEAWHGSIQEATEKPRISHCYGVMKIFYIPKWIPEVQGHPFSSVAEE